MEKIEKFLSYNWGAGFGFGSGAGDGIGSGYGAGDGDGDGVGDGSGYGGRSGYSSGVGDGAGDGSGYGGRSGDGYGAGYGDGDGDIKYLNNQKVVKVDSLPTIIDCVKGDYAIGQIVNDDLTTTNCWIAKKGNLFAHGSTLKEAVEAVEAKWIDNQPIADKIESFVKKYPTLDSVAEASELFVWHHILTGSCEMGRTYFCKEHNIDIEQDTFTIKQFIKLTINSYNGQIIKQLKKRYEKDNF